MNATLQCDPSAPLTALARMGREIFPDHCVIAVTDPRIPCQGLIGAERQAAASMRPARRQEFTAGRMAARRAMAELGLPVSAIPMGPDRAPVWPDNLRGSLTHCASACLAVLTRADIMLGIDVEPDEPLPDDVAQLVCSEAEQRWIQSRPEETRGTLSRLIFSAKEAAFKAQYPLSKRVFDFTTLRITPEMADHRFTATFTTPVAPFPLGYQLEGRFCLSDRFVLTGVTLVSENVL